MVTKSDIEGFNRILREAELGAKRDSALLGIFYLKNSDSVTQSSKENLRELIRKSKSTATSKHIHTYIRRLNDEYITGTDGNYTLTFEGEEYLEDTLEIDLDLNYQKNNEDENGPLGDAFVKDLVEVSEEHFQRGDYDDAVRNAFILLEEQIRDEGGYSQDKTGSDLATEAFNEGGPLSFGETDAEIEGVMHVYRGAFMSLRNPASHRFLEDLGRDEAHSILSFANLLLMWLDDNAIESK